MNASELEALPSHAVGIVAIYSETISSQRFKELERRSDLSSGEFEGLFNSLHALLRQLMRLPLEPSKGDKERKQVAAELR